MKQVWECKFCKVKVTLHIKPLEPPTHACAKRANRVIQLENKETEQ